MDRTAGKQCPRATHEAPAQHRAVPEKETGREEETEGGPGGDGSEQPAGADPGRCGQEFRWDSSYAGQTSAGLSHTGVISSPSPATAFRQRALSRWVVWGLVWKEGQ